MKGCFRSWHAHLSNSLPIATTKKTQPMNHKNRLAALQNRLQQKLQAKAFFTEKVAPCAELFEAFQSAEVPFQVVACIGFQEEWQPHLKTEQPLFEIDWKRNQPLEQLLNQLFEEYPSENSFRYVPPYEKTTVGKEENPLKKATELLQLPNQEVLVYWLRYAVVVQLHLYDLPKLPEDTVFTFWHGDVVIFPQDLNWLIAYSLEEEWYAGKK